VVKEAFNSLSKTAKVVLINIGILSLLLITAVIVILRIRKKGIEETTGILGTITSKVEKMTNTKENVIKEHEKKAKELEEQREAAVKKVEKDKKNNFKNTVKDKGL